MYQSYSTHPFCAHLKFYVQLHNKCEIVHEGPIFLVTRPLWASMFQSRLIQYQKCKKYVWMSLMDGRMSYYQTAIWQLWWLKGYIDILACVQHTKYSDITLSAFN